MASTTKQKRIPQGANKQTFGAPVCSFQVGESAAHPGELHVTQYSAELVGPLTPAQFRELALDMLVAANAIDGQYIDPRALIGLVAS